MDCVNKINGYFNIYIKQFEFLKNTQIILISE